MKCNCNDKQGLPKYTSIDMANDGMCAPRQQHLCAMDA
jgi:hypothetical protein